MKRPPGIWILLSAGILWLSLQDVYGIRATALIFGKSTTSTTENNNSSATPSTDGAEELSTEGSLEISNVTKPTLTGNPQIDYIYDPNLPKELNGYNLSDYPFYERVPEDIDFKCDGLHDGFYASITYKCQVYHHCLFGTRYDFLCANYTAFDQKTFICQFVSDVDCVNSKKFWHRNDDLYKAATTTTIKPTFVYTPPAQPPAILQSKNNQDRLQKVPTGPGGGGGGGKRRRPIIRRPQYDYYDDFEYDDYEYYDALPRSRRRRPIRPLRPRPYYDDEYEEDYKDEKYERKNRRPPPRRKLKNKNKYKDEDLEDEDITEEEVRKPNKKNKRPISDDTEESSESAPYRPKKGNRRPIESVEKDKSKSDEYSDDPPAKDYRGNRPNKNKNTNYESKDEDEEDKINNRKPIIKSMSSSSIYDRPRTPPRIKPPVPKNEANKYAYKPANQKQSSTKDEEYYEEYEDEPVTSKPKTQRRPTETTSHDNKSSKKSSENRYVKMEVTTYRSTRPKPVVNTEGTEVKKPVVESKPKVSSKAKEQAEDTSVEYESRMTQTRPRYSSSTRENIRETPKKKPQVEVEYYDYDDAKSVEIQSSSTEPVKSKWKPSTSPTTTSKTTTTTTTTTARSTTTESSKEKSEQIVRIVKRPFLPSRGGTPYTSRGLLPVGSKAFDKKAETLEQESSDDNHQKMKVASASREPERYNSRPVVDISQKFKDSRVENFKASPPLKPAVQQKYVSSVEAEVDDEDFKPIVKPQGVPIKFNYKPVEYNGPRTTQKPKIPERNPLDITENEYDVTLNDALNPTLPNLPVRSFPTGFSAANDYTYSAFQRPRFVVDSVLSNANTNYVYQQKPTRQQLFEAVPQTYTNRRDQFVNQNPEEYKAQYSTLTGQGNQSPNFRNRLSQSQTQAFYSSF